MSIQLLDKTRRINRILRSGTQVPDLGELCAMLADILNAGVMVIGKAGEILKSNRILYSDDLTTLPGVRAGNLIDEDLNERFLEILSTKENVNLSMLGFNETDSAKFRGMVIPVDMAGKRLGTLFAYKMNGEFTVDDIIVGEYATMIISMEMSKKLDEAGRENKYRRDMVYAAVNTLSLSEIDAVKYIIKELDGGDGILIASRIAKETGITRSVIVNALRKIESAGIAKSRSAGMKGTYIRIVNDLIYEALGIVR